MVKLLSFLVSSLLFGSTFILAAENQLRVLFNNGIASPGMNCTAADLTKVLNAIALPVRHLRQASEEEDANRPRERKLLTFFPPKCKETCKGFATGTCIAPACKGFRRDLEEDSSVLEVQEERRVQYFDSNALWCDLAISLGNSSLNRLVAFGSVSPSCVKLMNSPRNMTCLSAVC